MARQHGMTFWCGFGATASAARAHVAPVMEQLYGRPFDEFARYVPHGTPHDVAKFIAPYVDAGASTVNLIPFARSEHEALDLAAEVRRTLAADR